MESTGSRPITSQLIALAASRFVLNTGLRFVYPFAPALARALGVSLDDVTYLITLRNLTGLLSPLFGSLSEKYGRRMVLMIAMVIFSLGAFLIAVWPVYAVFGLFLVATGLAKILYDPAMQAHVGDEVPYDRRGRAVAVTEYSWSLALLVGVPLIGIVMQRQGWRSPFMWLGIGGLGAVAVLLRTISGGVRTREGSTKTQRAVGLLRDHAVVMFAALYIALFVTANEMLFIVFGEFMEGSFGLSLTSLGFAAAVIGGAELAGETIAGTFVDRFGKRPVIIITGLITAVCSLILPFSSATLFGALATLFVLFLAFEITIVGGIPLMTELVPESRAIVMSILLAAMFAGRSLGSLLGPVVWVQFGPSLSAVIWATVSLLAILTLATKVHEKG